MKFGITLKPDISVERIVSLTKQAEEAGFEYGWIFDSHVLWKEPYPLLTLMATSARATSTSSADVSLTRSGIRPGSCRAARQVRASADGSAMII